MRSRDVRQWKVGSPPGFFAFARVALDVRFNLVLFPTEFASRFCRLMTQPSRNFHAVHPRNGFYVLTIFIQQAKARDRGVFFIAGSVAPGVDHRRMRVRVDTLARSAYEKSLVSRLQVVQRAGCRDLQIDGAMDTG